MLISISKRILADLTPHPPHTYHSSNTYHSHRNYYFYYLCHHLPPIPCSLFPVPYSRPYNLPVSTRIGLTVNQDP
ncbi:MAG: hypothetical protein F6K26_38070 [Moorea sp. SIO2I5]|nr:hypothetical protein [Moorena sp. SIO2I5]